MKKILEMNHVQKSFNDNTLHVLKDISLSVSEGEVVSIIGPSGSGKSTLLRCATLLTEMDGGELLYDGEYAAKNDPNGRSVYSGKAELKNEEQAMHVVNAVTGKPFTVGNINAELTEEAKTKTETFKIVPGVDITKDPVATVKANSEDCYLFVELTEENWPAFTEADKTTRKVEYEIADGWTKLEDGVYYREVPKKDTDQAFHVLQNDKVTVSNTLTKENADAIAGTPELTVAVYAVQKEGMGSAADAWETAKAN